MSRALVTSKAATRGEVAMRLRPLWLAAQEITMPYPDGQNERTARAEAGTRPPWPAPSCPRGQDTSRLTLLEQRSYLAARDILDFSYGYPEGLNPNWITEYQCRPAHDFLAVPPAEYMSTIRHYFQSFFQAGNVNLVPTCSLAFMFAARALIRSADDEVIMLDPTYDSYAPIIRSFGGKVVYAERTAADSSADIASITTRCTERTKAIILCCPENPLGLIYPRDIFERIIALCKQRDMTLVVDHCLAQVSPFGADVPVVSRLDSSRGLSYLLLGDTGKILGLKGSKFGAVIHSGNWAEPLAAVQSSYFFQYSQYDLFLLASILSDKRFPAYLKQLNRQIAANYAYLKENLSRHRFRLLRPSAGCFALADISGLAIDDVSYVNMLARRYSALLVPASLFHAGTRAPGTKVRISLSRSAESIRKLVKVLNSAANSRG
jgi:aspartate/methionine/tyrosine aminotransferase